MPDPELEDCWCFGGFPLWPQGWRLNMMVHAVITYEMVLNIDDLRSLVFGGARKTSATDPFACPWRL